MKKIVSMIMALIMSLMVIGCGGEQDPTLIADVMPDLESGQYYVLNNMNGSRVLNPTYINETSFSLGSPNSSPSSNRVAWFRNDFNKLPVLRKGDSLVLYTTESVLPSIEFYFEKFEYLGMTIPIRGLNVTDKKNKYYTISTNKDDKTFYPESAADELLNLTNEKVVVRRVGNQNIVNDKLLDMSGLEKRDSDNGVIQNEREDHIVTRAGTINMGNVTGLTDVEVYDGTIGHVYQMPIDTYVLCSAQVIKLTNYDYINGLYVNIPIPDNFTSGYYMINAKGMFIYDDGINPINEFKCVQLTEEEQEEIAEENGEAKKPEVIEEEVKTKLTIKETGIYLLTISFPNDDNPINIQAMLQDPSGYNYSFNNNYDGTYSLTFAPTVTGECTITYWNLRGKTPKLDIEELDEEDF